MTRNAGFQVAGHPGGGRRANEPAGKTDAGIAGPRFQDTIECGDEEHRLVITAAGRFILPDHPREEVDRELALATLAEDVEAACPCVQALLWWRKHAPTDGGHYWHIQGRRKISSGKLLCNNSRRYRRQRARRSVQFECPDGLQRLARHAYENYRARWHGLTRKERVWRAGIGFARGEYSQVYAENNSRRRFWRAKRLLWAARWRWRGGLGTPGRDSVAGRGRRSRRHTQLKSPAHRHVFVPVLQEEMFPYENSHWRVLYLLGPKGVVVDAVAYLNLRAKIRIGVVEDGKWKALLIRLYQQPSRKEWEALAVRRVPPAKGRPLSFWVQHCVIERVRGFKWRVKEWLGEPLGKSVKKKSAGPSRKRRLALPGPSTKKRKTRKTAKSRNAKKMRAATQPCQFGAPVASGLGSPKGQQAALNAGRQRRPASGKGP